MGNKKKELQDRLEEQNTELEMKLNRFSFSLIKIVGIAGVIIGLTLLILFWGWIISLFR